MSACNVEETTIKVENIVLDAGASVQIESTINGEGSASDVEYSFNGNSISISNGVVTAITPNTVTTVTATLGEATTRFTVTVRPHDNGIMTVSIPKTLEREAKNTIYSNYPARELVPVFSTEYHGAVEYTIEDGFEDKVFIENGKIWAVGDFSTEQTVEITAKTAHHIYSFNVKVVNYTASLNLEFTVNRLLNDWQSRGGQTGGLIYIGDSFFDEQSFFKNFYDLYEGQNAYCLGIGATLSLDWELLIHRLVKPVMPKYIALHIGKNNIYNAGRHYETVAQDVQRLIDMIHQICPDTHVIYVGMEPRRSDNYNPAKNCTQIIKEFCNQTDYVSYIETYQWWYLDDGTTINGDMYKAGDGTHPSLETYNLYFNAVNAVVAELEEA